MKPPEFADELAALDARLARLLDAVRRTRQDIESQRVSGTRPDDRRTEEQR